MAVLKLITTGAELLFKEPKTEVNKNVRAVVAPRIKSGLALAQYPTLMEFQTDGWYLKATDIFEAETSLALMAHSESAAVFTAKDCKAESIMSYWRRRRVSAERQSRNSVGRNRLLFRMMMSWQRSLSSLNYAFLTCFQVRKAVIGITASHCDVEQQRCY